MANEFPAARSRATPVVLLWLIAAWAFVLAFLCIKRNRFFFQDDSFITLRYARHLAEGFGPVWNRTGHPVEGFSSPLHVLLLAGLDLLQINPLISVRLLGFAFHALLIAFVWNFMRTKSGPLAATLASALIAASWPMLTWDLGGLETVPYAAFLASGALVTLRYLETGHRRDVLIGGILLGLAILTRPEGFIVAAVALASCLLFGLAPLPRRTIDVLIGGVLCGLPPLAWEIFRIRYFHAYLPNTYYAKIVGIPLLWRVHSGLHYLHDYIRQAPYSILFLIITAALSLYRRRASRFDLTLWACISIYGLYVIETGGDFMAGYRFMVPLVPLVAVALARGLQNLGAFDRLVPAACVSAVLLTACTRQATHSPEYRLYEDPAMTVGEAIGRDINIRWPSGSVVALDAAGATAYFADNLNYIDMLGLNDDIISHRIPVPMDGPWSHLLGHLKANGQSVLDRHPEFLFLRTRQPIFLADYELQHSQRFASEYKPCAALIDLSSFGYNQLRSTLDQELLSEIVDIATGKLIMAYYQRRDLPYPCTSPTR